MQHDNCSGGLSTQVIELEQSTLPKNPTIPQDVEEREADGALPSPATAVAKQQRWNSPRINMYRCFATFWSFLMLGANDGAYGALIPYLEKYYNLNYTVVSLVFVSPVVGYSASAFSNNAIHVRFGQRGVAMIISLSHLVAYTVIAVHPPYPVLVVIFVLAGFGNGLGDAGFNAWIGDMVANNEVLGFLHASYGLGAALSPLIATTLITKVGFMWYQFYYFMIGGAVIEICTLISTFWAADGKAYREEHPQTAFTEPSTPREGLVTEERSFLDKFNLKKVGKKSRTAEALSNKVTWLSAIFLLCYVGIEVSIGGWVVTFMLRQRNATPFAAGLTSTGFWLGITVGRICLGFVTARVFPSEKSAVATYITLAVVLQLLFWLIPHFVVSVVMIGLLGVCLAPMFPAAIVAMTKLLPKQLHVPAVGFSSAFGASGACILPFAVGAIAQVKGVKTLQPIILALLVVLLLIWLLIPKLPKVRTA